MSDTFTENLWEQLAMETQASLDSHNSMNSHRTTNSRSSSKELVIERDLINQLTKGESQWGYRPDLNSEEKLWDNFFEKLEENNVRTLADHPLKSSESVKKSCQIFQRLRLPTL